MRRFASDTAVSTDRSKAEIEKLLARHGATRFMHGWDGDTAAIGFCLGTRTIRFLLPLPARDDGRFHRTPGRGLTRRPADAEKAWEQSCRANWRALLLVIKAKLEAAAIGISTIEDEFLAWTVLPGDGRTLGQVMQPQIEAALKSGRPPQLLLTGGA